MITSFIVIRRTSCIIIFNKNIFTNVLNFQWNRNSFCILIGKMTDDENEDVDQLRCALSAIADEVQKFHIESSNEASDKQLENEDILNAALIQCKSTLKLKNEQIRILRQHLKTACTVSKYLAKAKESETTSLSNQLKETRSQYWDYIKQQKEKNKMFRTLQADNEIIRDKLQCLNNIIQLGYQQLQNIRDERLENIPSLKQLQKIIFFCGQYYADYCNEREKCIQLEQKNRFLNSKVRILESHQESCSAESQRVSLSKIRQRSNIDVVRSETQIGSHKYLWDINKTVIQFENPSFFKNVRKPDLACHLKTVKKLLLDQDCLLKDLKSLSKEINVDFCTA